MQEKVYRSFLEERKLEVDESTVFVAEVEKMINSQGETLDLVSKATLRKTLDQLISNGKNTPKNFIALARYFYAIDNKDRYLDFTALFGSIGVLDSIMARDQKVALSNFEKPEFGIDTSELPSFTEKFMACLEENYTEEEYFRILAGNNHNIPKEAMLEEKQYFEKVKDLDRYLIDRHKRKVEELKKHQMDNTVWFEQIITKEVVEFVASNQEVLSAMRKDNYLFVTKIPFDTKAFLEAKTDDLKRYYACHCPFVREGVKTGNLNVNHNWCYCSAGFAKYPFEVMFDQELTLELLETPLKGDFQCRFKIEIPDQIIKDFVKT